jgi:hypothetical protein
MSDYMMTQKIQNAARYNRQLVWLACFFPPKRVRTCISYSLNFFFSFLSFYLSNGQFDNNCSNHDANITPNQKDTPSPRQIITVQRHEYNGQ